LKLHVSIKLFSPIKYKHYYLIELQMGVYPVAEVLQ
jgi:hypothetical protein